MIDPASLPVGPPVPDWQPCARPSTEPMLGRYCRLEALDTARHVDDLYHAFGRDRSNINWTYLPYGPFDQVADFRQWVDTQVSRDDPLFYVIVDDSRHAVGVASYLRIAPEIGSIEVGHIHYSPLLQRHRAGTEAMYLMMRRAFDELNYRRYEWKCDALNAASRKAAERFGFVYEGTFRQATIYKGRNRDTAWYSIIDSEWPNIRQGFEAWLDPANFDDDGNQLRRLELRGAAP